MNIPPKYEDVVAQLDAALAREAALREDRDQYQRIYNLASIGLCAIGEVVGVPEEDQSTSAVIDALTALMAEGEALQQRLTVAEQKLGYAYDWGYSDGQNNPNGYSDKEDRDKCVAELLKPAAEQRAAVMEKALSRIAREHDCGCSPCTGSCTSQVALEITVDAMRDIAIAALKQADGEVS